MRRGADLANNAPAMKYRVTIGEQEREIDVHITPEGRVSVALDGQPYDADVVRVPGGVNLLVEGRVFDIAIGGRPEDRTVAAGPRRAVGVVESERQRAKRKKAGGSGPSDKEIRSPMPGRVVKILVKPGDQVEANAPAVVVEAMKMENELRTTGPGKVKTVEVTEGQSVEGNTLLVTFE